jgi:hypothetical protein
VSKYAADHMYAAFLRSLNEKTKHSPPEIETAFRSAVRMISKEIDSMRIWHQQGVYIHLIQYNSCCQYLVVNKGSTVTAIYMNEGSGDEGITSYTCMNIGTTPQ